jgi:ubiquinone/menaquinone biosynthesis C-methylase UbiE
VIGWLYDLMAGRAERAGIADRRTELLAELKGEIIEIGSGTGASLPHYRQATRVVAVEPDESMASRLPARVAEASVPVEVITAQAEELPFPDGSFDAAVFAFVLCSVGDQRNAIAEARRVLKPGGKLVLLEHVRGEGRTARWQERLTPLHRKLAGNCHLDRDTLATVEAAGFDVREVERIELPGTHALVRPGVQGVATKTSS